MFTVEFAALAPFATLTTSAPVFAAFAIFTLVAVTAVANNVFPVEFSVVDETTFGVVDPRAGGVAKIAASTEPMVAGLMYALVNVPAAASVAVAALTVLFTTVPGAVAPGGYPA